MPQCTIEFRSKEARDKDIALERKHGKMAMPAVLAAHAVSPNKRADAADETYYMDEDLPLVREA